MNSNVGYFFEKRVESEINTYLLENDYTYPSDRMLEYVKRINEVSIQTYLKWLDEHFSMVSINVEDAVQYSSLSDITGKITEKMICAGDKGFSHLEIGKLLQDDGVERKDGAYTKYGENHAKTATYLGYLYSLKKSYYVSSIGYILPKLADEEKEKLYARMFIRTNLFKTVYYLSKSGDVNLREVFDMLSEKTYVRRRSNMKMLFQKLVEIEPECAGVINKIRY